MRTSILLAALSLTTLAGTLGCVGADESSEDPTNQDAEQFKHCRDWGSPWCHGWTTSAGATTGSGAPTGSGATTGSGASTGSGAGTGSGSGAGGASSGSGATTSSGSGSGGAGGAGGAGGGATGKWVSGYYVGYQQGLYPTTVIDWAALTHVFVGRVVPNSNGTLNATFDIDAANGPVFAKKLVQLAHQNGKKAVVMLGGSGTLGGWQGASGPQNRAAFVQNLKQLAVDYGFDGFDLDWEPLASGDQPNFKALAQAIRAAMPSTILTVPVQWTTLNNSNPGSFYGSIAPLFDQINIMSYEMAGGWSGWQSWHSSAIYGETASTPSSIDVTVKGYLAAGVPAAKLGIGIGFYGACWSSPVTGPKQSPSQIVAGDNTMTFDKIMTSYYSDAAHHWDATARAPYLSFSSPHGPQGCTFVSYEDPQSVLEKGAYVKAKGLGGTIVWTINQGYRAGQPAGQKDPMMEALKQGFLQ